MKHSSKRWRYQAIWLITLLPVLIAWLMAYTGIGLPNVTKNNGILLPAGIQAPASLTTAQNGKWGLLVISEQCNSACQRQLYRVQQLHKAMGKDYGRLQPIWLTDTHYTSDQLSVVTDSEQLHTIHDDAIINWFNQQGLTWQDQSIWLLDPNGILVMRFKPELTGKQMLADLHWLLLASHIG